MRKENKKEIYYLPNVENYLASNEPIISDHKRKIIEEKLELEKQALAKAKQKQKRGQYFMKYNFNPFSKDSTNWGKRELHKSQINLIDEIVNLNSDEKIKKSEIVEKNKEIQEYLRNAQEISQLCQKQPKGQISKKSIFDNIPIHRIFQVKEEEELITLNIQDVLKESEDSFFLKNQKKINIFRVGKDNQESFGPQILDTHYFSFNSVIEKLQKIKVSIYRDMSSLSRKCVAGLPTGKEDITDYIDSYELSFKLKELLYHDLMSTASGRFSADFLNKVINLDDHAHHVKEDSDKSSEESITGTVVYRKNDLNQACRFHDENEEQHEIIEYKNLEYNKEEKNYLQKCERKQNYILGFLEEKEDLYQNTIRDNTIHGKIAVKMKSQLEEFAGMRKQEIGKEKLVLQNKRKKNKNQSINLKTLLSTLAYKQNYEENTKKKYF